MITYRLADALPRDVVEQCASAATAPARRDRFEAQLDCGYGSCLLRNAAAAAIVTENWQHFARVRYVLHAWVVMPNHVHLLITTRSQWTLAAIVQSWKSYTAKRIRRILGGSGPVWQREYWDRVVRDERHFAAAVDYIHQNPVRAGLVATEAEWRWSSLGAPAAGRHGEP